MANFPTVSPHWCCEGFLDGPTEMNPRAHDVSAHAVPFGPVGQTTRVSVDGEPSIDTRVSVLFSVCGPAAIPGCVWSIIIRKAIKRVTRRRPGPDVAEERREVLTPTDVHPDTACSIVKIFRMMGIVAPLFSRLPRVIFTRTRAPMRAFQRGMCVSPATTARGAVAAAQRREKHAGDVTTFAAALQSAKSPLAPSGLFSEDRQASEHVTNDIAWLWGHAEA